MLPTRANRPASATDFVPSVLVYVAALVVIVAGYLTGMPPWAIAVAGLVVAVLGLVALEIDAIRRGHRIVSGMGPAGPRNWSRTFIKLLGLAATLACISLCYAVIAGLLREEVGLFLALFPLILCGVIIAAPFLFVETDRRMAEPEDAYYHLGNLVMLRWQTVRWDLLRTHGLGWAIKAFFLPLMLSAYFKLFYTLNGVFDDALAGSLGAVFMSVFLLLFVLDLLGATIGYSMTFRLLGTQIRSTNSHVTGWIAALICYPPFSRLIEDLNSHIDMMGWADRLQDQTSLLVLIGGLIFSLQLVYVLATVNFGLRFSNLTHRGIVTGGVYRWTKHPAYLAKNAFWWVMTIPFIATMDNPLWVVVCMLCINVIYFVRAKTEEQHLMTDASYRAYVGWIEEHGLFAPLARLRRLALGQDSPYHRPMPVIPTDLR